MIILAGKAIATHMLISARAFLAFGIHSALPEKFNASGFKAVFLLEYVIWRDLEIEFLVSGVLAGKYPFRFIYISNDILHI
jgi:hypothetical protein